MFSNQKANEDKGKYIKINLAPQRDRILSQSSDKKPLTNLQYQKYNTGNSSSMIEKPTLDRGTQ